MIALALAVVGASLLGSLHCAGMCGGLVVFASGHATAGASRRVAVAPLEWNAGRLVAYASVGAIAGALGRLVDLAGAMTGVRGAALVLSGMLVVLWGAVALAESVGRRVPHLPVPSPLRNVTASAVRRLSSWPLVTRALLLGVLAGCLPCGWLWAFVVTAAGTGSALGGAIVMALFWLGTLPVLLGLGLGAGAITPAIRRLVPAACAIAMIVVGLVAVGGRTRVMVRGNEGAHHGAASALDRVAPTPAGVHDRR